MHLDPKFCLPDDLCAGTLTGRVWLPAVGPAVVALRDGGVFDISESAPTCAGLLNEADPVAMVRSAAGKRIGDIADILANSAAETRNPERPYSSRQSICRR